MLRLVLMGTPAFAIASFSAIVDQGHDIVAVYTRPPAPAGRGLAQRKSPVHLFAMDAQIPVLTPHSFNDAEVQAAFAAHEADAAIVVAYGLILPRSILDAPVHGCFNLHASLLPRWRGAAPIQRALMAGDSQSGVSVIRMEQELDAGPVCMEEAVSIEPDMTAGQLHDLLARRGADLMVRVLAALSEGALRPVPQDQDAVLYARKIGRNETRIDWSRPACAVHDHVRALSPYPGAWCEIDLGSGKEKGKVSAKRVERVKILRTTVVEGEGPVGAVLDGDLTIACGTGAVRVLCLQRAGKRPVGAAEFLRGSGSASDWSFM